MMTAARRRKKRLRKRYSISSSLPFHLTVSLVHCLFVSQMELDDDSSEEEEAKAQTKVTVQMELDDDNSKGDEKVVSKEKGTEVSVEALREAEEGEGQLIISAGKQDDGTIDYRVQWDGLSLQESLDWPLDELDNPTLGHNLVGKQLKLKWKKEGCQLLELGETGGVDHWLGAECIAFNAITRAHRVQYTDADEEDLNMLQAERDWFVTK